MRGNMIKRNVKILLCLFLLTIFSACGKTTEDVSEKRSASAEESPLGEPFAEDGLIQSLAATVEIFADNYHGSGVIYAQKDDGIVLVTAAHVIPADCQKIKIVFGDGEESVCTDYRLTEQIDGAFLEVKTEMLPADWQEKYGIVKKDRKIFDAVQSEDGVFLRDYDSENDLGCRFAMVVEGWIYVEDFGTHMMLVSGEAHSGMSGCGVFEENGCFLGILCGANDEGELAVLPYSLIEANFTKAYPS
ncbi:MAG: serine protease [Bacteroidales bacterium]|nr:serine protease [Bacteroidales bacterium]